jgi:hypothetical protein
MVGKYTSVNGAYCKETANYLSNCFSWIGTPEGGGFWQAVYDRLVALGRGERPTESCIKGVKGDDDPRIKLLTAIIEERDREIASLSVKLVTANKKLMISDWVNHSLPRGTP